MQPQPDTPNSTENPNAPLNHADSVPMDIKEVIVKAPANNRNGLILNDSTHLIAEAILLKTQECGETDNNAIIVQTD